MTNTIGVVAVATLSACAAGTSALRTTGPNDRFFGVDNARTGAVPRAQCTLCSDGRPFLKQDMLFWREELAIRRPIATELCGSISCGPCCHGKKVPLWCLCPRPCRRSWHRVGYSGQK
jgi:hypothetical protein